MPTDGSTEVRCPDCNRLVHVLSADFRGAIRFHCPRCKAHHAYPPDADVGDPPRINCPTCGKWLCSGVVVAGALRSMCHRCKGLAVLTGDGVTAAPDPRPSKPSPLPRSGVKPFPVEPAPADRDAALVAMVEQRWAAFSAQQARDRASVAVGLRFAVFNRDNFRCRYCGRSVDEGAILEADHVHPRSKGGLDTMANLVTACWDCNRGKSDREVDISPTGAVV